MSTSAKQIEVGTAAETGEDLPEGWTTSKLHDLVSSHKGKKPKRIAESLISGFVPYIDIEAFEKGRASRYADPTSSVLILKGDLLVVWDGARSGLVGVSPFPGALGSTLAALRLRQINPMFLRRVLDAAYEDIKSNHRGTGIPHVDPEFFWNLIVPLPPLAEQTRIVKQMQHFSDATAKLQARLYKSQIISRRFRQAVLAAACSGKLTEDWREHGEGREDAAELLDRMQQERRERFFARKSRLKYREPAPLEIEDLPQIPSTWRWTNFDHCSWEITVGHVGPMKDRYVPKGVTFLRSQNVRPLRFDSAGLVYIPSDFDLKLSKSKLLGGEILVVRSGANTGQCCVFPSNLAPANCADLVITRPLDGLLAAYGALYINSPIGYARLLFNETGMAQPHFNIGAMRIKAFPLPPFEEQQEIVWRVEELFKLADAIEKRVEAATLRAERLTQAILAKAFRGELVPTEAELARQEGREYEPAAALLERIKKEREKNAATAKRGKRARD